MKILHVVPSFGLGGMEKVMCSIINAIPSFVEQEVLILSKITGAKIWISQPNIRFLEIEKPEGNIAYWVQLFRILKNSRPAILMTYNWGATDAIWLGWLLGISRILHSEHGFNADEAGKTSGKRNIIRFIVYRLATYIIVVSNSLVRMMENQFLLSSEKIQFVPNGIRTDVFIGDSRERVIVRKSLKVADENVLVGFSGRLDPVKNLGFLLKTFGECFKRDSRFRLVLIGDGPERAAIEKMSQELDLGKTVQIIGQQSNVLQYLRAIDVFLLTSTREQMPMSMLEAMAVGVPVVASSVGEIPGILENQHAGFSCELRLGLEPFINALFELSDAGVREKMGRNARRLVVERFQEKLMIERYMDLLFRGVHVEGNIINSGMDERVNKEKILN